MSGKLEVLVHRLEILVHILEVLVHRLDVLVHRLDVLVHRLDVLVHRLEVLVHRLDVLVHFLDIKSIRVIDYLDLTLTLSCMLLTSTMMFIYQTGSQLVCDLLILVVIYVVQWI